MHIRIICPAARSSRTGNRTTAQRWARILRGLGHRASIHDHYAGERCDLLIAMHARRSAAAVRTFHRRYPQRPLVVALTGTDLYRDLSRSRSAQHALALASRLILLQPLGVHQLPATLRSKARVIYQSAIAGRRRSAPNAATFDVCVIANLRPVKDPLRTALAARALPSASRIRVLHIGAPLSPALAHRARNEMQRNPRYHWLGERPPAQVRALLPRCRLLVLSSRLEGGANAVSEAITAGVPVLATRVPGSCGLIGERYPGLFPVGDSAALCALMRRAETDPRFYATLARACAQQAPLFHPARESRAWARLLKELTAATPR